MPTKVFLIELSTGHSECLETTVNVLANKKVPFEIIANQKVIENLGGVGKPFVNKRFVFDGKLKKLKKWLFLKKVANYINGHSQPIVFFNTCSGKDVLTFLLFLRKNFFTAGILHDASKLSGSFTQYLISKKIKEYLVLAEYIRLNAVKKKHSVKISTYYTDCFFSQQGGLVAPSFKERTLFVVPGQLENKRRDNQSLVSACCEFLKQASFNQKPLFVFLGNGWHAHGDGAVLKELVEKEGLAEFFQFYEQRVPEKVFHGVLENASYLMPLIHSEIPSHEAYFKYKISGSFNLARHYKIPLILEEGFSAFEEFQKISIFYKKRSLGETLQEILRINHQKKKFDFSKREGEAALYWDKVFL